MKYFKISYLILVTLFSVSLYVITSTYLNYATVTNVQPVIFKEDLPPIIDSYRFTSKSVEHNWKIFQPNLTLNGKAVVFNEPFIAEKHKYQWDIEYSDRNIDPTIQRIERQIFELFHPNNSDIEFDQSSFTRAMGHSKIKYRLRNKLYHLLIFLRIIELLPYPFDTHCYMYKVSQNDCYEECNESDISKNKSNLYCTEKCSKRDCKSSNFFETLISLPKKSMVIAFENQIISLKTVPKFTTWLYVQDIIGLVEMFFDLAILSVCNFLLSIKLFKSYIGVNYGKISRYIVRSFICIGFTFHLYVNIASYMEYRTSTETYFGEKSAIYQPTIRICPYRKSEKLGISVDVYSNRIISESILYNCVNIGPVILNPDIVSSSFIEISIHGSHSVRTSVELTYRLSNFDFQYPSKKNSWINYGTQIFEENLLRAPYWTKCYSYDSAMYTQSKRCYEKCLKLSGYSDIGDSFIIDANMSTAYSSNQCNMKCRRFDSICDTIRIVQADTVGKRSKIQGISIDQPKEVLSLKMSPSQNMPNFITYTATLFALWLGVSAVDLSHLFDWLKHIFVKIYKVIAKCFLLVCCIVQIYFIIRGYSKYEIVSKVNMWMPESFNLPVISILDSKNHFADQLSSVELMDPRTYRIENSSIENFKISKYYYGGIGVDSIYSKNDIKYSKGYSHHTYLSFKLKTMRKNGISVDLRSSINEIYFSQLNPTRIDMFKKRLCGQGHRTILLPTPYSSRCIRYKSASLYDECIANTHHEKYTKYPNNIVIANRNISTMEQDKNIVKYCSNRYGNMHNCESIKYSMRHYYKKIPSSSLDFLFPKQETSCIFIPKMVFYDLIILLFDALGLWLGISLIFIIQKMESCSKTKNNPESQHGIDPMTVNRLSVEGTDIDNIEDGYDEESSPI